MKETCALNRNFQFFDQLQTYFYHNQTLGYGDVMPVARIGVSLEPDLLKDLDKIVKEGGYSNRSQALRDLIRSSLSAQAWRLTSGKILAAITILYDSSSSFATRRILERQHDFYHEILSSTHFHISHTNCLEVLVVSGSATRVKSLIKSLKSIKGVLHADVIPISRLKA